MAAAPPAGLITSRRTVTTAPDYPGAERAIDWLSDQGFPVEHAAIVGTGLRYVEEVSGRRTTGGAVLYGAGLGALFGLAWGLLFALLFTLDKGSFLGLVGYSVVIGIVFGAVVGVGGPTGGQEIASGLDMRAERYEVQIDDGFADAAERLLARMPAR
jgi:hypothetical protein